VIFDLQRFSVHDGPGIRSLIFFKGCTLRCQWCSNPESHHFQPEILFDPAKCVGCWHCANVCPNDAVLIEAEEVHYDRKKCSGCGCCAKVCYSEARVLKGMVVTADWVVDQAVKDEPFFSNSGGGVTLGGGEPLAQPEFASSVLQMSKQRGLHTVVETSGYVPWTHLARTLPCTDLFLFDLKHVEPTKHRAYTGGDVGVIISNLNRLAAAGRPIVVRIPSIPTFNDTSAEIAAIARTVATLGLDEVHLLPYHSLGQSKYGLLGRECSFPSTPPMVKARLEELKAIAEGAGLTAKVGG